MEVEAICLQELSDELLVQVFARIGHPPKLASCTRLSKRFHAVLSDDGVWRDIVVQAVLGKQPPRNGVPLGLSGPDDSYRHAYVRLMYDVSRLEILRDELVNSSWRFYFQADMYLFHCSPEQAAQRAGATGNQGHLATFLDNGLFTSNIAGAPSQRTPTRWQLLACAEFESDCPSAASSPDLRWGEEAAAHKRLDVIDDNDGDDEALTCDTAGADSSLDSQREVCATAAERRLEVGEEEGGGEIGEDDAAVASAAADIPASRVRGPLSPAGAPLANLVSMCRCIYEEHALRQLVRHA